MIYEIQTLQIEGIAPLLPSTWLCSLLGAWSLQWSHVSSLVGHNHEVLWGSIVTSIRILFSTGKSSFIWDARGSILVNMQKHSKKTSNSSWLGTSAWVVDKGCALGVKSSPDMVTVSLCPWNGILSTSFALRTSEKGGIDAEWGVVVN